MGFPCKNAADISIDCIFHELIEATTKTSLKDSLLHVGESVLISEESSSNPLATKRALIFLTPFFNFSVIIQREETVFWLSYGTISKTL